MKKPSLLKSLLLFAFIGLCSTACNDDDGHVPMPNPEAECRLISGYGTIEYNAKGYATKLINGNYGVTVVTYDAHNQAVKTEVYEYGEFTYYYTLEYTKGLLTTITKNEFSSGSANEPHTLTYDSKNRLSEERIGDGGDLIATYTYDSKDNLTKLEFFDGYEVAQWVITYEDYDNNPTPYSAIKGLPGFYFESYSKNNPGKSIRTEDKNQDGIIESDETTEVITYTYTYNSNGYPTRIAETGGENPGVYTFDYACD